METEHQHIDFIELIGKYLSWEASQVEIILLENWVQESPENKSIYQQYRKTWQLAQLPKLEKQINVNSEWGKLQSKINQQSSSKIIEFPKKKNKWIYNIAASILLIFSVGTIYYFMQYSNKQIQTQQNTLAFYFSDSTKVTINQNSQIKYSKQYNKKERRVQLAGDAFFEVTPNKTKAFIVETQNIEIRVLGTAFYVNSRKGSDEIEVIVEHGKVSVTGPLQEEIILTKGEKAIFKKEEKSLVKEINSDPNYLAWESKVLHFNNTKLSKVIEDINKAYHTELFISDSSIQKLQLTATYKEKSLKSVLKLLSETLDLKITKKKNKIKITAYN